MDLPGYQRNYLRKKAQGIKPVVMIGKLGVGEPVRAALDQNLTYHELVKVKFLDFKDDKREFAGQLASETNSVLVQLIGNMAIFYREHPAPEQRKYALPTRDH